MTCAILAVAWAVAMHEFGTGYRGSGDDREGYLAAASFVGLVSLTLAAVIL